MRKTGNGHKKTKKIKKQGQKMVIVLQITMKI